MARSQDLHRVAEILTDSFHPPVGPQGLIYPFLKFGIYEDLRSRLQSKWPNYTCLTAFILYYSDRGYQTEAPLERDFLKKDPLEQYYGKSGFSEEIVGTLEITLRSLYGENYYTQYPYISNLAVSPNYRRRGVARQLLSSCETTAREWGFRDIYLHVLENNEAAKKLYFSLGYTVEKIEQNWFPLFFWNPKRLLLHKFLD